MEYMRTLLRDNELFRTYVTVSPGSAVLDCRLSLWETLAGLSRASHVSARPRPAPRGTSSALHFQFVT